MTQVPAKTESGRPGKRAMRFAGIDGPRWFVRAVFSGINRLGLGERQQGIADHY